MKKLSEINEGAIGDILKRAASSETRIEDDVNNLDMTGFVQYLREHYTSNGYSIYAFSSIIKIPLIFVTSHHKEFMEVNYENNEIKAIDLPKDIGDKDLKEFFNYIYRTFLILHNYKFSTHLFNPDMKYIKDCKKLVPKLTNKHVIDIIEHMISLCPDKCMLKKAELNEGAIGDIFKRAVTDDARIEDGVKVKTILGNEIRIKNTKGNFNKVIENILSAYDAEDPLKLNISTLEEYKQNDYLKNFVPNILKGCDSYNYLINKGHYGKLVAGFGTYEDVISAYEDIRDEFDEKDYISICKGVADKLSSVSDFIELMPHKPGILVNINWDDGEDIENYKGNYLLQLVDENTVGNWLDENNIESGHEFIVEFCEGISKDYPKIAEEDFLAWSYNNGSGFNLAIPINLRNLLNIKGYSEWARIYFKVW